MINRSHILQNIKDAFDVAPVCALIGPRQCGKTTLARHFSTSFVQGVHFFDLEDARDLTKLQDPILALENREGLIIIDEIHHAPDLFKTLRVLVDQKKNQKFLILGSASYELLKQSSETLAGRLIYINMHPFSLYEVQNEKILHVRGGFPDAYLAQSDAASTLWRKNYIKTFLEKDIRNLGFNLSSQNLRRFWAMMAHYHGQVFNASELATSLSINYKTIQNYCDILESTFMLRRLTPWMENLKKRQVKAPKYYFQDSGILHHFLGITTHDQLLEHPKLGASFEGFAIEQIITTLNLDTEDCFYWRTHNGAELDLLIFKDGRKQGFEFKYTSRPSITASMKIALADLNLDHITIIIPGNDAYPLHEKINVSGLSHWINTPH